MNVDLSRVLERLDTIYECGKQEDGSHSRLAFSPEDQKGRNLYMSYFRALGLTPKVDAAGNIRVRLSGRDNTLPAILMGSHLDTVPNGGKYDGALGCVAALEVFEVLRRSGMELEHQDIRWIRPEDIPQYVFCPADEAILRKLRSGAAQKGPW